ncbi:unnamed protein product [Symbiodinium sp. CCMP2592]|nr:unnamed protein product [Symbiodinium sp. CCMP2592]
MAGPKDMAATQFANFRREFFNDEACLEVVRFVSGGAGQRLLSKLKSNAHRADVFRHVEHWLRGGFYLDIKTAFLITPLELHSSIVAEWKQQPLLTELASKAYGWDADALRVNGPPDYFLTAIGHKKDHIFQGILLGRHQHPLLTAALRHAFQHKFVDAQGTINETYLFFCIALFDIIRQDLLNDQALHPGIQGRSLAPGWHLTQTMGPIYLLQEVLEKALKHIQGAPPNEGHGFRTATNRLVALTRCWGWNKGWKADPASTRANNDAMLRGLPAALHEAQEAGNAKDQRGNASPARVPTDTTIQAHVLEALETNLLEKIEQLIDAWPQYYGELSKQQVQELIPRGLSIGTSEHGDTLCCAFCRSRSGGSTMFHTSNGLLMHFMKTRGGGATWHHAGQEAYNRAADQRSGSAASSSSIPGGQRPNEPASPPPNAAPRPAILDAPHRPEAPPPEPEESTPTMEELWVVAVADLQSLTAPEVVGVLQPQEFTAIWNARLQALAKLPRVLSGLRTVYQRSDDGSRDLSWRSVITGKLVVHRSGHLTMVTVDRSGNECVHPKLTTWLGGLQAIIKNGVPYALFEGKHVATQDDFRLFATTLQTIYEAATKKAHQPSHVNILQATSDRHPTIKITHGQALDSKVSVIQRATGQQLRSRRDRQAEHRENKEYRRSDPYALWATSCVPASRAALRLAGLVLMPMDIRTSSSGMLQTRDFPPDLYVVALEEYLLLQAMQALAARPPLRSIPAEAGMLSYNDLLHLASQIFCQERMQELLRYTACLQPCLLRSLDTHMPFPYRELDEQAPRAEVLAWHLLQDAQSPLWCAVRTAVRALAWRPGRQHFSDGNANNVTFGAFARGPHVGLCAHTVRHGSFCRLLNRLIEHICPDHIWSTFSLNYNVRTPPHRDQTNSKTGTLLLSLSHHDEGSVWVESYHGTDYEETQFGLLRGRPFGLAFQALIFPAHNHVHCTRGWSLTDRVTLAAYCISNRGRVSGELKATLSDLGFHLQ